MKQVLRQGIALLFALLLFGTLFWWLFRVELAEPEPLPAEDIVEPEPLIRPTASEMPVFSLAEEEDAADTDAPALFWDTAPDYPRLQQALLEATQALTDKGYRLSFVLYDLNSGNGIRYCSIDSIYGASAIKGPYVACIAETVPDSIHRSTKAMSKTIQVSSNDDYRALRRRYGNKTFAAWVEEAGCAFLQPNKSWPALTSHDLALLWVRMFDFFESGTEEADWTADLYVDTFHSFLSEALGETCTVYSKAGWINSSRYYTARNDAGIVMKDGHPYVLAVLSDAYRQDALLIELVQTLDTAHTWLVEHDDVQPEA